MFMRRGVMAIVLAGAFVVGVAGVSSPVRAQESADKKDAAKAGDVSGTYTWTAQGRNNQEMKVSLKLKQEGEKITGTITGFGGRENEIQDGKIDKDGNITFKTVRKGQNGQEFTMNYSAKVDGEAIKGKSEFERNGEKQSRDFEGKKAKPGEDEKKEGEKKD